MQHTPYLCHCSLITFSDTALQHDLSSHLQSVHTCGCPPDCVNLEGLPSAVQVDWCDAQCSFKPGFLMQLDIGGLLSSFTTAKPQQPGAMAQQQAPQLEHLPGRAAGFAVFSAAFGWQEAEIAQLPYVLASCLYAPSNLHGLSLWKEAFVLTVASSQLVEAAGCSIQGAGEAWHDAAR